MPKKCMSCVWILYIYRTRMTHHQPHLPLAKAKGNCEYLLISPFWVISPDITVKNTFKKICKKALSPTHSERSDFQNELVQTPTNLWALATPWILFLALKIIKNTHVQSAAEGKNKSQMICLFLFQHLLGIQSDLRKQRMGRMSFGKFQDENKHRALLGLNRFWRYPIGLVSYGN